MTVSTITNAEELQDIILSQMGGISDNLGEDLDQITNQTLRELQWNLPNSNDFQCYWLIERGKRHALYVLIFEAAKKFRFKQIFLQQRFENYIRLLEKMDNDFLAALEQNPDLFDVPTSSVLTYYITNGFSYDWMGRELTFGSDYWV